LKAIKVKITSFMDEDYFPGAIECKFIDAWNVEHTVLEKYPLVTNNVLDAKSEYPQDGFIVCELIKEWKDPNGRILKKVNTEMPWGIETTAGLTEFDLEEGQLIDYNWG
jgi:hypothetical protein